MSNDQSAARVAGPQDVDGVVDVLVSAFADDPTWAWVFPDKSRRSAQHGWLWRLFVEGAARYHSVWVTEGNTAAAVWVPPGGTDLSTVQEVALEQWIDELPEPARLRAHHAIERFEAAHPREVPHYFLGLLGTHSRHLGRGHGLGLLAANLRLVDEVGLPAYLEASNLANVPLYERYGFRRYGAFTLPDGPEVITMWRER